MVRQKHQPRPALLGHELCRPDVQRAEHDPGAKAKYLASLELRRDLAPPVAGEAGDGHWGLPKQWGPPYYRSQQPRGIVTGI